MSPRVFARLSEVPTRRERTEFIVIVEMLCHSDLVIHLHRSHDWLDFTVPGAIDQRGDADPNDRRTSVLDSFLVAAGSSVRRHNRLSLRGISRQQDVSSLNGSAVDRRMDLLKLRQLHYVAVRLQDTFR